VVLSRIGGGLVLATCACIVVAFLIASGHGAVGIGAEGFGGLVVIGAMVSLGLGAGLLALATPPDLRGRLIRAGLALLALGLLILVPSAGARMDEPLIFALLIGGAIAWLGVIVTMIGLVWRRGRSRRLAITFLLGLLGAAVGGAIANVDPTSGPLDPLGLAIAALGGAVMLGSVATIGYIAVRSPVPAPANGAGRP